MCSIRQESSFDLRHLSEGWALVAPSCSNLVAIQIPVNSVFDDSIPPWLSQQQRSVILSYGSWEFALTEYWGWSTDQTWHPESLLCRGSHTSFIVQAIWEEDVEGLSAFSSWVDPKISAWDLSTLIPNMLLIVTQLSILTVITWLLPNFGDFERKIQMYNYCK